VTPERWAQIEELFHRVCECEPQDRDAVLNEACRNNPELRREEALLASEENASDHLHAAVRDGIEIVGFPLAGETISHYHILDGLAGGGMGVVYRAEDIRLGRRVALKFLPEASAKDSAALGRFEREARSASALEHPNICPIYEFGEHKGQPFLVMQLLEGQTLRELICAAGEGKPPLELGSLLDLAIQITEGLDAAHRHGMLHRDIKPANIFITSEGQAKILDFGLAKLARLSVDAREDSEPDLSGDSGVGETPRDGVPAATPELLVSLTGVAMGTPGYMSPEQVRGETLDARTDLFSFGLVLYEMATGKRAFAGDTGPALLEASLKQTPTPARALNPAVPPKLEAIIDRALEKDREGRYQSAAESLADLRAMKREMEPKSIARRWKVAAGAVVLLLAATTFWFARRQSLSTQTPPEVKLRQLTANSSENRVLSGKISPDGKYLAYTDGRGIHAKFLETDETSAISQPAELKSNKVEWDVDCWFPDSTRFLVNSHPLGVAYFGRSSEESSIWVVSLLGEAPRRLRDHAIAYSISPDGSLIAFGTNSGKFGDREIWLMGTDGDQARKLYDSNEDSGIGGLTWTSDGQRGSYVKTDGSGKTLVSRDLKGGPLTTLLPPSEMAQMTNFSWLPDGRLIYSGRESGAIGFTCNYWAMRIDPHTGERIEKPRRLTNGPGICMDYSVATADGRRLSFLGWDYHATAYVADLDESGTRIANVREFTFTDSGDIPVDWTADSRAIILMSKRSGHSGIYKQSLNEETAEPLVTGPEDVRGARVSPDGASVVYTVATNPKESAASVQVRRVPITGGPSQLVTTVPPGHRDWILCARSPSTLCVVNEPTADGKQFVISAFDPMKGRGPELARFDLDPTANLWLLALSPDGTRIAALRGWEGAIQILSLRGQPAQVIPVKGWNRLQTLDWAADGKGFYVSCGVQRGSVLLHVDLQGNAKVLWKNDSGLRTLGRPSPDGRHLAIQVLIQNSNIWMIENF
jgi:serine/threonine protein kinase